MSAKRAKGESKASKAKARWHSLRLRDPSRYARLRWQFRGPYVATIRGELPGGGWEDQSLRFLAERWTEGSARAWATAHGLPASGPWEEAAPVAPPKGKGKKGEDPAALVAALERAVSGTKRERAAAAVQARRLVAELERELAGPEPNPRARKEGTAAKEKAPKKPKAVKPPKPPKVPKPGKAQLELIAHARRPVTALPSLQGLAGEAGAVIMPSGGGGKGWGRLPIRWAVVDSEALIPSHLVGRWIPHPSYPPGVQERDYGPKTVERLKVESQIQNFEPALLNSDAPTALDGPPLITSGGLVIGGNSRAMTVQAVLRDPKKAGKAREALLTYLAATARHGDFPRAALAAMPRPVLVRILELSPAQEADPAHLRALVNRANQSLTQALDPRRQAASAAARLSAADVEALAQAAPEDKPPSEWLRGPVGRMAVQRLRDSGALTERDLPRYVSPAGDLNDTGRAFILKIFAAHVIDDPELLDDLQASELDEIASASAPILAAAGYHRDIRPELRAMLRQERYFRSSGKRTVAEWLAEPEMYEEHKASKRGPQTEVERLIWEILEEHRGKVAFPQLWRRFAGRAALYPGNQTDLTGYSPSTADLLRQAMKGKASNPLRVDVWHKASDAADPSRSLAGEWPVPAKGAGALAAELGRKLGAEAVILWWLDPLGALVPVGKYRTADGRRLGDPVGLRVTNPSNPGPEAAPGWLLRLALVDRAGYERAALDLCEPELRPFLRWHLASGRQPSPEQWTTARRYLRHWADRGDTRAPWGVLAVAHDDGKELHAVDSAGYELQIGPQASKWVRRERLAAVKPARRPNPCGCVLGLAAANPATWRVRTWALGEDPESSSYASEALAAHDYDLLRADWFIPGLRTILRLELVRPDGTKARSWGVPRSSLEPPRKK